MLVLRHKQRDYLAALGEIHAAHAACVAPHRAHVVLVETHRLAHIGEQHHIVLAVGQCHTDQEITRVQGDCDDALCAWIGELRQRGLFHGTAGSGEENELVVSEFLDRQHRVDLFVCLQRQQVHDRLAARAPARLRHLVHLQPVRLAVVREAQDRVVRIGDEQLVDEILVLDLGRGAAATAALLRPVVVDRLRLGITAVRQGHNDLRARDQVLDAEVAVVIHDLGAARVGEVVAHLGEFAADDFQQFVGVFQNIRKFFNFY